MPRTTFAIHAWLNGGYLGRQGAKRLVHMYPRRIKHVRKHVRALVEAGFMVMCVRHHTTRSQFTATTLFSSYKATNDLF